MKYRCWSLHELGGKKRTTLAFCPSHSRWHFVHSEYTNYGRNCQVVTYKNSHTSLSPMRVLLAGLLFIKWLDSLFCSRCAWRSMAKNSQSHEHSSQAQPEKIRSKAHIKCGKNTQHRCWARVCFKNFQNRAHAIHSRFIRTTSRV